MTEPGTSPTSPADQQGRAGPANAEAASTGAESTGRDSAATEPRTATSHATVPQQVGQGSAADAMTGSDTERADYGYGISANINSAWAARSWVALLVGALAMIAVGVTLLVWPSASLNVVAILIGAAIVASGVVRLYEGFTARADSGGMRAAYVVIGLLAVIVGIYCIRNHALTLFLVAFVTGVYFIMHGIADIGVAVSAKVPGRGLRAVLGVFSIAAGIIMVVWPSITLVILFTLVAAWLLFYGVLLAMLAFRLRRASKGAVSKRQAAPVLAASS
jgi:uncharacterized membrane protein HdeD (DUF308 family)